MDTWADPLRTHDDRHHVVRQGGRQHADRRLRRRSGRINLATARDPWFTFDETGANCVANADALYNTNYPSLYVPVLAGQLTVARTLKIALDGRDVPLGETRFATITFTSGNRTFTFPVTVVRGQGPVAVDKTCAPDPVVKYATVSCSVTLTNSSTTPATLHLRDPLPKSLDLKGASVVGGTANGNTVRFNGTIAARQPSDVTVVDGTGTSPRGWLPAAVGDRSRDPSDRRSG